MFLLNLLNTEEDLGMRSKHLGVVFIQHILALNLIKMALFIIIIEAENDCGIWN